MTEEERSDYYVLRSRAYILMTEDEREYFKNLCSKFVEAYGPDMPFMHEKSK